MVPMAAHDEHTDVNCGMAVPLQEKVSPPDSGITTFLTGTIVALMPAAVTGWVEPFITLASASTEATPSAWLLLTSAFLFTLGMKALAMAAYSFWSAFDDAAVVGTYEPASALSSVAECSMLGSWQVGRT